LNGLVQVGHQLSLEGRLTTFLVLRVNASKIALEMALDLILEERRVSFFCFLLLIEQKFCQENSVLGLILL
jgi:hypothetical protein